MTREYSMSPEARQQRRGAPHKHGLHAQSVLAQVMPPCMPSKCPYGQEVYPCELRQAADADGRRIDRCPVVLGEDEHALLRLAEAIVDGDIEHLAQGSALSMRLAKAILDRGLVEIFRDGLTIEEPMLSKGEVVNGVVKHHTHPSAKPVIELMQVLGLTADQQAITPKSKGERKRDEAIADSLSWMSRMRQRLHPPAEGTR